MEDKGSKAGKRWCILICFLLVVFLFKYLSNGFLFGYRTTFVMTESMETKIPVGSVLLERKYDEEEELSIGDIITFSINENKDFFRVTHRIVGLNGECLYTKGDANPEIDNWHVTMEDVESKVIFIYPYTLQTGSVIAFVLFNFVYWKKCKCFKKIR